MGPSSEATTYRVLNRPDRFAADRAIVEHIRHAERQRVVGWGTWEPVEGEAASPLEAVAGPP